MSNAFPQELRLIKDIISGQYLFWKIMDKLIIGHCFILRNGKLLKCSKFTPVDGRSKHGDFAKTTFKLKEIYT